MTDTATPPPVRRRKGIVPLLLILAALALLVYLYLRSTGARTLPPPPEPTVTATTDVTTATPATPAPPVNTRTRTPRDASVDPPCQDYLVAVGPDPSTLSQDPVCVGPSDRVVWRSWDGQTPLKIYFPTHAFPDGVSRDIAPFSQMRRDRDAKRGTDDWVFIYPSRATTNSGPPNARFGRPGRRYRLKYDQELGGRRADGHMIIQK